MRDLTPLDIQKQHFRRGFRGYAIDEVRAYLHLVAEEIEHLVKQVEILSRENALMREEIAENTEREKILKDTLLSAQKVSEELRQGARKEAELIVKDAELLSERLMGQAMDRVGDLERTILDLKLERKESRRRLQNLIETVQTLLQLDAEQEEQEEPITRLHRKIASETRE
ncbi:MAG TPA: DivIVA domain-containing protein [Thermoanaerobaculia bacterium]|nr:DivIVA domain-containing protein [Thermoanaerobaculia bacterium]